MLSIHPLHVTTPRGDVGSKPATVRHRCVTGAATHQRAGFLSANNEDAVCVGDADPGPGCHCCICLQKNEPARILPDMSLTSDKDEC